MIKVDDKSLLLEIQTRIERAEYAITKADVSILDDLLEAKTLAVKIKAEAEVVDCLRLISQVHLLKSDKMLALECAEEANKLAMDLGEKKRIAQSYKALGNTFMRLGDSKKTLEYYHSALNIYDEIGENLEKAKVLSNMGSYYGSELKDNERAERYLMDSWKHFKDIKNIPNKWIVLNELGKFYRRTKSFDEAKKYFDLSYESALKEEHKIGIQFGMVAKARRKARAGNYKEAIAILDDIVAKQKDYQVDLDSNNELLYKSEYLGKLNQLDEAITICRDIVDSKSRIRIKADAHGKLHEYYKQKGKIEEALFNYEQYIKLTKEIEAEGKQKELAVIEFKHQLAIKDRQKEIMRLQKIEMEQKALRAQLNPHFFFNSLNSINKFIINNDKETATQFLVKFGSLMRKTLENSEESFITIEDEMLFLNDYISLEQMRFNNSFNFKLKVEEDLEPCFTKIPTMLLQPYVENCIKHGLVGVKHGLISISFEQGQADNVKCIVEDNGLGRKTDKLNGSHKSLGTKIIHDRLMSFTEQYNLKFEVDIEDLSNGSGEALGTRVILTLPDISIIE